MTRTIASEDLLVRARRERLEDVDERRLEMSLSRSRELLLLYEAGVGFDAESGLLPGDEARTARLVELSLRELERRASAAEPAVRPRKRSLARHFAFSVACTTLFTVAVASAWQYAQQRWSAREVTSKLPGPPLLRSRPAVSSPQAPVAVQSVETVPPASAQSPARGTHAASAIAPATASPPSARELFTRGSVARRKGDLEAAISLYQLLCSTYPSSIESADARLALGNLRMEQRSPRAALREFESYGSGPLLLEALWGRARALRSLASPEERAVLERLVREYPGSPYAAAAQKRLLELTP